MKKPSDLYDELQRTKKEKDDFLKGRELEQLNLFELSTLYGIVSRIELLMWALTE